MMLHLIGLGNPALDPSSHATWMTGKDAEMKVFQIVDKPKSIITICLFSRLCKKSTE